MISRSEKLRLFLFVSSTPVTIFEVRDTSIYRRMEENDLARFFESRYGLVLGIARRYAPAPDMAYDIAQQSFVMFLKGVREKGWDLEADRTALLCGIVKNIAIRTWTREQKNISMPRQMIAEKFLDQLSKEEYEPKWQGHAIDLSELRLDALKACTEKLPQEGRAYLEQHYREGVTLEEIAQRNGVKPNTIRKMFCRLRKSLQRCIDDLLTG